MIQDATTSRPVEYVACGRPNVLVGLRLTEWHRLCRCGFFISKEDERLHKGCR